MREFDATKKTVTVKRLVTDQALSLLEKADALSSPIVLKEGHVELNDALGTVHMPHSAAQFKPFLEELEKVGLVEPDDSAWFPTWNLTAFGKTTAQTYRNPPRMSLPLLLHTTAEAAVSDREGAATMIEQTLTDAGLEVEYVRVTSCNVDGCFQLVCESRFFDDDRRGPDEFIPYLQDHLGLPEGHFEDHPEESRLTCRDMDGIWTLRMYGPRLDG